MATYSQRFGSASGTVLDVQATIVSGAASILVTGVKMTDTNTEPKRTAKITLDMDGDSYEVDLEFADESFNTVGITGGKITAPAPL